MKTDILILGGGPAGASAAIYAKQKGYKTALVEKAKFPRDKVCGDGLSTFTTNRLKELELWEDFQNTPHCRIDHMAFGVPNGSVAVVPTSPEHASPPVNGYTCKRTDFDTLIYNHAANISDFKVTGKAVSLILNNGNCKGASVKMENGSQETIEADITIGADGYPSMAARHAGIIQFLREKTMVSVRAYFEHFDFDPHTIEMHFPKLILPGYVWIFPVSNTMANVGICLPKLTLENIGRSLQHLFQDAMDETFPDGRFKQATQSTILRGGTLPLGTTDRVMGIPGLLLCGDAAGLIDPFTGEGIGNAMTSSKLAIESVSELKLYESAEILARYEQKIRKKFSEPFGIAWKLHGMASRPYFLNFLARRANSSNFVRQWLSGVLSDSVSREVLTSPFTYIKLLMGKS